MVGWDCRHAFLGAKMPRICTICSHAEQTQIDQELVRGLPYRDIAGRFAISKSAVERHASEHLASAIARVGELRDRIHADTLIGELRVLREVTLGILEEARESANHGTALRAIARLEKQAELVARLAGELVERQRVETVAVIFSEQWQKLRPALVKALLPHPEAAAALEAVLEELDAGS